MADTAERMNLASAGRLGPYRPHSVLAASYYGSRYLATNTDGSAPCTLTVIEAPDAALLQRLARAASSRIEPEHALRLRPHRVEIEATSLLCAAPFVEGATSRELADGVVGGLGAVPTPIVTRIALDALEAIDAAATPGAAHGGVHADTLHVGADGRTRLLDCGLAAAAAMEPRWSESPRRLAHAAPESCAAPALLDIRSDFFSLGTILWELISGRPLFTGSDPHQLREQLLRARIPRVHRDRFVRGEPIPAALANFVARALARAPAERFARGFEARAALAELHEVATREEVGAFVAELMGAALRRAPQISNIIALRPAARAAFGDELPTQPLPALPSPREAGETAPPPAVTSAADKGVVEVAMSEPRSASLTRPRAWEDAELVEAEPTLAPVSDLAPSARTGPGRAHLLLGVLVVALLLGVLALALHGRDTSGANRAADVAVQPATRTPAQASTPTPPSPSAATPVELTPAVRHEPVHTVPAVVDDVAAAAHDGREARDAHRASGANVAPDAPAAIAPRPAKRRMQRPRRAPRPAAGGASGEYIPDTI